MKQHKFIPLASLVTKEEQHNELSRRIQVGIKWLNKTEPNWINKVKITQFRIEHTEQCVIGQVFGDYIRLKNMHNDEFPDNAGGFALDYHSKYKEGNNITLLPFWKTLQKLWLVELRRLKKAQRKKVG